MNVDTLRKEYAIQRAIDSRLDEVIEVVKHISNVKGITSSQLSNLLATAKETDSVQVVIAWIQYQMGRSKAPISEEAGEELINAIENDMYQLAESVADEVGGNEQDVRRIWQQLVRLYLGHLKRHFIYLESLEKRKHTQSSGRRQGRRRR